MARASRPDGATRTSTGAPATFVRCHTRIRTGGQNRSRTRTQRAIARARTQQRHAAAATASTPVAALPRRRSRTWRAAEPLCECRLVERPTAVGRETQKHPDAAPRGEIPGRVHTRRPKSQAGYNRQHGGCARQPPLATRIARPRIGQVGRPDPLDRRTKLRHAHQQGGLESAPESYARGGQDREDRRLPHDRFHSS